MRITRIAAWAVDLPLHEGSYKWSGGKSVTVFDSTVVAVETDAGITGYGEVCPLGPAYLPAYAAGVRAVAALLTGGYRLGKRAVAALLRDLFGVPISIGAVCKLQHRTADALAPITKEAREYVVGRPANVDETTWKEGCKFGYVWVAVTQHVTAFLISLIRNRETLGELIPGQPGLLTTDRLSVYYHLKDRQLCWSHLRRDFQALIDRKDEGTPLGEGLLACADRMLASWRRVRDER